MNNEQELSAEAIKELIRWSNSQSLLLSLLYDLDMMPEQVAKSDTVRFSKMIVVMLHFKQADEEHSVALSDKDAEIERTNRKTCQYLAELEAARTALVEACRLLKPLGGTTLSVIEWFDKHQPEQSTSTVVSLTFTVRYCLSVAKFLKKHSC